MAFEKNLVIHSFTCASAMTAVTAQYTLVKQLSGGGVGPILAVTDLPVGVLQNSPDVGQLAEVAIQGITKLRVGAVDLTAPGQVTTDAAGRALTAASGSYVPGAVISINGAADNDGALVTAMINCINPPIKA